MTPEDRAFVTSVSNMLFERFGPESAVVVMVGAPEGKQHSAYQFAYNGRCLLVEGLLTHVGEIKQTYKEKV